MLQQLSKHNEPQCAWAKIERKYNYGEGDIHIFVFWQTNFF